MEEGVKTGNGEAHKPMAERGDKRGSPEKSLVG
jgi:hypothetical protein